MQLMREVLTQQGHDLTLIARDWQGEAGDTKLLRCNPPRWSRVQRESGFAREALRLSREQRFDLVQSHERIPGCMIYRAGDGVHRCWLEQRMRAMGNWSRRMLRWSRYHRYVLEAERALFEHPELRVVICNSRMVREEIASHFQIEPTKLHVIYNGVDTQRFHPRLREHRSSLRQQLNWSEGLPVWLFVGSGWERKGLEFVLNAMPAVPQARLVIVGRDKAQRRYERLAGQLGLIERVRFVGVQRDVSPWYGMADALVHVAMYDPFPNVTLEALASGLPILTSPHCGTADWIREGLNGYICDPWDREGLVSRLRLLTDVSRCEQLGRQARITVEPHTPEKLEHELSALYETLAAAA